MKPIKKLVATILLTLGLGLTPHLLAQHQHDHSKAADQPSAVEEVKTDPTLIEKLKKDYPLDTCVVSGDKLGGSMGEAVDYLFKLKNDEKQEIRLVRFCCKDCIKKFKKEPEKYMKKIEDAAKAKATPSADPKP